MEIKRSEIDNEYQEMMSRIGKVFANEAGIQQADKYIKGLMGTAERKNGWQVAEYLGEKTPYAIQQFLYRGKFCADELRDELRGYVGEKLGDEDGVMVVDETGF